MTKNVDYFFSTSPNINERIFRQLKKINKTKSILLGPVFIPIFRLNFPIIIIGKKETSEKYYMQLKRLLFIQQE